MIVANCRLSDASFDRPAPDRLQSWISGTKPISCDPPSRSEKTEHVGLFRRRNRDCDPAGLDPYRAAVSGAIAQYRDRFLTRGGTTELLEKGRRRNRVVILEFPDTAAVKRWYDSS